MTQARSSRTRSAPGWYVQQPSLDYGQLRAVFVLVAHRPTTGATASYLATMLRLDRDAVAEGLERLHDAGLLSGLPGSRYKLVTMIRGFSQGQAGAFFETNWPR